MLLLKQCQWIIYANAYVSLESSKNSKRVYMWYRYLIYVDLKYDKTAETENISDSVFKCVIVRKQRHVYPQFYGIHIVNTLT